MCKKYQVSSKYALHEVIKADENYSTVLQSNHIEWAIVPSGYPTLIKILKSRNSNLARSDRLCLWGGKGRGVHMAEGEEQKLQTCVYFYMFQFSR